MKRRTQARSSSLFLMELILAIMLFTITAAVCVQLTAKAHSLSRDSALLNSAVNECSTLAEIISSSDNSDRAIRLLSEEYPGSKLQQTGDSRSLTFFYDENYMPASEKNASHRITADISVKDGLVSAVIKAEKLYSLEVKHYTGEVR